MFDHTDYQRKRRKANPERFRKYAQTYYHKHKVDPKWKENRNAYLRHYYIVNRIKRLARSREWHQALKKEAIAHYGEVCACCGEDIYEFLCIDHINGGGNKQRALLGCSRNFFSWLKKTGYPEGFRTLCHNCNQAFGLTGTCPHQLKGRPPENR